MEQPSRSQTLRKSLSRLQSGLRSLREMYATESMKQWFAPGNSQEILKAGKYLNNCEHRAAKLPYLLDHGATKVAAKILHKARESFSAAHSVMRQVQAAEEKFRLQVTEEIHLS